MFDPVIAIAASPRDWPRRLYRYVTEHGGAQVRGTVLDRGEALAQASDVLLVDDITSFLDEDLVRALHGCGRRVLGVHESAWGRDLLSSLGVDTTIERCAPAGEFLTAAATLAARVAPAIDVPRSEPAVRTARILGRVLEPVLVCIPLGRKTVRTRRCASTAPAALRWCVPQRPQTVRGGRDGGWD
ncbi:MAG: hypothetical protein ACRD0K_26475 [Egibacteraceae bacterium]